MIPITKKLKEIHTNLWSLYDPPSQSSSTYTVILICEYTWKTWNLYFQGKNNFIDAFQT